MNSKRSNDPQIASTSKTPNAKNDNARAVAVLDTTTMLASREVTTAIRGALVKRGVPKQDLEDATGDVQVRALEVARDGQMPANVAEWKALATTIAANLAKNRRRDQRVRHKYEDGLCEEPDNCGPPERPSRRDPVDTRRYLEILAALFREGRMPDKGVEILESTGEGLTAREVGEELGVTEKTVELRLARMRRTFRKRLASLHMLTLVLLAIAF